jgi:hypothetical protein
LLVGAKGGFTFGDLLPFFKRFRLDLLWCDFNLGLGLDRADLW